MTKEEFIKTLCSYNVRLADAEKFWGGCQNETFKNLEWRVIPGYSYVVTRCGRVLNFVTGKEIRPMANRATDPYFYVYLYSDKKRSKFYVQRLVAEMWLLDDSRSKRITEYEVNHIDGNSANNHADNLELTTRIENMKDMWARRRERKQRLANPCPF